MKNTISVDSTGHDDQKGSDAFPVSVTSAAGEFERVESSASAAYQGIPPEIHSGTRENSSKKERDTKPGFNNFRKICNGLIAETRKLRERLDGDVVGDSGTSSILLIEQLVDQLYGCDWGDGESLQRIAVELESQILNATWTVRHVAFLSEFLPFLATRYTIDGAVVDQCVESIRSHGLDPARGILTGGELGGDQPA